MASRPQRSAPPSWRQATALLAALLVATCVPLAPPRAADRGGKEVRDADELLIVDCLLPPKVRRLGRRNTYLAPREPIRTTALECGIRGGEYTEPDQANLGTALKVWLPRAKAGDAEAQYYVGQIFEKGLGVTPDYSSAATWYRRAADQGYGPAQINLGSLYETGRGVEQDARQAMLWYRKAAGLAEDLVVLQESEVEELEAKGERLDEITRRLEETEAELERSQGEAEELRRQRRELEETGGRLEETSRRLEETEAELERSRRQVEELRQQRRELEERQRELRQEGTRPPPKPPEEAAGEARFDLRKIPFGSYHALVIGNRRYQSLAEVPTAEKDARAVAATLEQRYGFAVDLLVDATRLDIMRALNSLREDLTSEHNLLVYYAGHAHRDGGGTTAYWQPVDAEPDNPANWIPSGVVSEHLDLIPARHVLLVADSLFSGLRSRSVVARLRQGMTQEERFHHVRLLRDKRCRLVLSSGRPAPRPGSPGGELSGFAAAFVETLRDNDGVLEASGVYRRLNRDLAGEATPEFAAMQWARNDVSDFFFIPKS